MENYYKILNVSSNATVEEIKKSYRKLALEFHPDKNKSSNAHDIFISINQAYKILSDESLRKEYDDYLSTGLNDYPTEEKFNKKEYKQEAEKYSSMKVSDFENILDEITNVGRTVKKGVEMGCGFIMMIICGILTLLGIISLGKSELGIGVQIILIIFFGFFTLIGWALSRKDT